ncbi:MAG TPA: hypothetical protein PKN33_15615 [Phycisphaerae bacterium]|nr:hypothetical protein [Phycisphaerae bacterium]
MATSSTSTAFVLIAATTALVFLSSPDDQTVSDFDSSLSQETTEANDDAVPTPGDYVSDPSFDDFFSEFEFVGTISAFFPLKLGMSRERVLEFFPGSVEMLILVNPSTLAAGYDVSTRSGRTYLVAFDGDDCICYVSTGDEDAELSIGIKPGSSYESVKQACPQAEFLRYPGYGTAVEISETEWAVFCNEAEPPRQGKRVVSWVELKNPATIEWASPRHQRLIYATGEPLRCGMDD